MFENTYRNKRVLVTGHTGFKGSWLSMWLINLGAEVIGYSKDVPSNPSHFEKLNLENRISHYFGDVCDFIELKNICEKENPEIIFHLAAQPIVMASYEEPLETFRSNTLGTMNVAEVCRVVPSVKGCVFITSDKAYRNVEWEYGYREDDTLGGEDPYSGSKGAAELVIYSYANSFFKKSDKVKIASARAGNVIGGGDWADNRIIPDVVRSWIGNKKLEVRSPYSTRPWQHVLEPLSGYLALGVKVLKRDERCINGAYNFGPDSRINKTVGELLEEFSLNWPEGRGWTDTGVSNSAESNLLKLCCDKANIHLDWYPTLNFQETVEFTASWYKSFYEGKDVAHLTNEQIEKYTELALKRNLNWIK